MNTSMGQFLNGHPFLALAVLVFGAMATVPIGIFLTFATVTFIAVTVGFILLEGKSLHYRYNTYCPLLQYQYFSQHCSITTSLNVSIRDNEGG